MADVNDAGSSTTNPLPPFLRKLYAMVDDPETDSVVSWSDGDNSFVVWNPHEFAAKLLPKHFKHKNLASFIRQLNTYGFKKMDSDRYEFANVKFLKGQTHLLKSISRRKPVHVPTEVPNSSAGACVEVGKFGLEEEVKRLERDKNVLMQELVKLRQHQQATDHQLQNVGQRMQVMEQRQQQMMSFLAKAMQSPGLFAQFVQQQNESDRNITGGNKKRRLPSQEEESVAAGESRTNAPKGQIIKYQASLNETAKALLQQILKMNESSRVEPLMNNPDVFLLDDAPFTNTFDSGNSSNRASGVTLSEFLPISAELYMPAEPEFPIGNSSPANSEIQSSSYAMPNHATEAQFPNFNVYNSQEETVLPNFTELQGIMPKSTAEIRDMNLVGSETGIASFVYPMSLLDGTRPIETDTSYPRNDLGALLDEIPVLPGINETFWEQFLMGTPISEDVDEISSLDGDVTMDHGLQMGKKIGLDKIQHMNRLTEQMGLLASEGGIG